MTQHANYHMTPDEFRRYGRAVIDWIADYYERVESFPVLSQVQPGEIRASLPVDPPQQGESLEAMLRDVEDLILPGITHWQSPNFFAYFPANASGPAILGDLLSSGLGVQGMLWATRRVTGYQSRVQGNSQGLVAYVSTQTHSSLEKAAIISGLGTANIRAIEVDGDYAMRPDALARQIEADRAAGLTPFFVCATVGTTSSNAIDPLPEIGRICRQEGLWLHVDAAMAGTAALCPELRWIHDGLELADSYCFNPHKWMFTNFDCDCFYVADRAALIQALSILPEYLRNEATESGAVFDYRDWQIPLGRRFRALKLWFVIRHYGVEGLRHHVRRHVELAQEFAQWVRDDEEFELAAPAPLNLVCFRHRGGDQVNEAVVNGLNRDGGLYLTHTKLDGRYTIRMSIGQTHTEARHVQAAWRGIRKAAQAAL
jgi:aromatic-L-amino-acid decarboxylase